jgi:hypothetical protein
VEACTFVRVRMLTQFFGERKASERALTSEG